MSSKNKLPFEEWRVKFAVNFTDEARKAMKEIHNLDLDVEAESVLRKEYDLYASGFYERSEHNTMKLQTLEYYDWDDVEQFLSDAMGIDKKHFRGYHPDKIPNYWRIWGEVVDLDIRNDSYHKIRLSDYWLTEYVEIIQELYVDWDDEETPLKLIDAMRKLREEIGKDKITVHYYW